MYLYVCVCDFSLRFCADIFSLRFLPFRVCLFAQTQIDAISKSVSLFSIPFIPFRFIQSFVPFRLLHSNYAHLWEIVHYTFINCALESRGQWFQKLSFSYSYSRTLTLRSLWMPKISSWNTQFSGYPAHKSRLANYLLSTWIQI